MEWDVLGSAEINQFGGERISSAVLSTTQPPLQAVEIATFPFGHQAEKWPFAIVLLPVIEACRLFTAA